LDFNSGFGNKIGVLFRGNGSSANRSMALRLDQGPTSRLTVAQSNFNPNPDLQTGWNDLVTFEPDRLSIIASGAGATPILDFNSGFGNKIGVLFRGNGSSANQSMALRLDQGPTSSLTVAQSNFNPNSDLRTGWNDLVTFQSTGNVGIGTENPTAKLDVAGRTKTCVLEITGGCDLAEPFEISESQPISKGALVIIDEENPGRLKLSYQAYDKRVAGVVSGAGGINPGLTLAEGDGKAARTRSAVGVACRQRPDQTRRFVDDVGGSGACNEGDGSRALGWSDYWEGDVEVGKWRRIGVSPGQFTITFGRSRSCDRIEQFLSPC
jgi:hypothetical protein